MELQVLDERELLGKDFTVYGDYENHLFLAKDVAGWIEHSNVSAMLNRVSEEEKLTETLFISGQKRDCLFLTEDGLYEILMQSRKAIAKRFKKQVKTILKEIRICGFYKQRDSKIDRIEKLLIDSGIIRLNVNPRYLFERCQVRYKIATGDDGHRGIHEAIGDYFGFHVPYSGELPVTLREWLIEKVGIDAIQEFIVGIESGTIVKSVHKHWVNLNGFGGNDVEWNKVLREFGSSCAYCGRSDVPLIPEHIIAQYTLAQESPESVDLIGNIVPSCGACNKEKAKQNVDSFFTKQPFYDERRLVKIHRHQEMYKLHV